VTWHRSGGGRRRSLTAADLDLAWVMYEEGRLTLNEIASEMGVASGTLGVYLRELRAAKGGMAYLRGLDTRTPLDRHRPPAW
jgi:transposase-like protein